MSASYAEEDVDKKQHGKVVSLRHRGNSAPDISLAAETILSPAVTALRDYATEQLRERVKQVFAKVDDSLFAMAERAHRQEEQDGLFHALRLLRVERGRVVDCLVGNIAEAFQSPAESEAGESVGAENLSLVHNDDLEQLVAVDTMVASAKRAYGEQVTELTLRLDTLYSEKISNKNNPIGVDAICTACVEAVRPLNLHIRARLTLLKKFEQHVVQHLDDFYQSANQLLVGQGVLPTLRQQRREARRRSQPTTPGPGPGMARAGGQMTPGGQAPGGPGPELGAGGGHFAPGLLPATAGLAPMAPSDLVMQLGALQAQASALTERPQLLDVNSLLQQQLVEQQRSASLAKADRDVIKLVEMLFSFMLDDRNLAEPIKSHLGRLQLPLLKVAIADKSFFSKGGHPARKLLNELADASTGWQAGEQYETDPLFCEVARVVDSVVNEFEEDISIFDQLLQQLRSFTAREKKRAAMLEQRIVDEADGRAKTQAARARVAAVLEALSAERELPGVVSDWLEKVWNHALFLICVKEGSDSEAWAKGVRTARDLIWSVEAPMPENQQQLQQLLPSLQQRLRDTLEMVSVSPFEARRLFGGLKDIYREQFALAQRILAEREQAAQAQETPLEETPAAEVVGTAEVSGSEVEAPLPEVEELQEVAAAAEVVAEPSSGAEEVAISEEDPHWQQTFRLSQGNWFEFKRSDSEQFRCRLAAVIRDIDQFIFVNRNGAKVAEFSRRELALALRSMELMPLDDGMLFERALQSVINDVRRGTRSHT
ncbi:DUF1631 domain-containing protein [Microbulbifer sp. TYP-18]|uniref:DUF1631 domain-containing protein n=1 Tax=Microbulbifer sp. TYP-18 TaxID=3230024 RepID=UPI0034C5CA90